MMQTRDSQFCLRLRIIWGPFQNCKEVTGHIPDIVLQSREEGIHTEKVRLLVKASEISPLKTVKSPTKHLAN